MEIKDDGDLTPHVNAERCLEECHLYLDICSFLPGIHNLRERNLVLRK